MSKSFTSKFVDAVTSVGIVESAGLAISVATGGAGAVVWGTLKAGCAAYNVISQHEDGTEWTSDQIIAGLTRVGAQFGTAFMPGASTIVVDMVETGINMACDQDNRTDSKAPVLENTFVGPVRPAHLDFYLRSKAAKEQEIAAAKARCAAQNYNGPKAHDYVYPVLPADISDIRKAQWNAMIDARRAAKAAKRK